MPEAVQAAGSSGDKPAADKGELSDSLTPQPVSILPIIFYSSCENGPSHRISKS